MGEYTEYINGLKAKYCDCCLKVKFEKAKVSVIIPILNEQRSIEKILGASFKQTFKNIEIIMVDYGSNDFTHQIINTFKDLDTRVRIIMLKASNYHEAKEIGIKEANGEFKLVLDSKKKINKRYIENFYEGKTKKDLSKHKYIKTYRLFGKFPIFRYKDMNSHYIFNFWGIRISIRHKTNFYCPPATCSGTTENKRTPQLIVSLTSYPPRIKTTAIAINTLLHQKVKPDRVILWLADSQFPQKEKELPSELLNLTNYGLEIKWCKDLGSYKKIVPTLKEFPKDIIVTADDDIYYQEDWLESLYNAYLENPQNIYVKRAVAVKVDKNTIKPLGWEIQELMNDLTPSFSHQLMSGSGCLFPPHSLHEDIFDINNFLLLIPTHDDIYLWIMAILKGTKIKVVGGFKEPMEIIEGTDEFALYKRQGKNGFGMTADNAYKTMVKRYPEILKLIK